ncbi:FMN-binding negative transcriptional regulator [uncultured Roseibium sp.]|uniref:FMN-binding negative transcriptional regulator n=1 Tax=uncultured Roseibium sp. TaxID=1936171 RepID=UPI0032172AE2
MYTPPAFAQDDLATIHGMIRATGLATLVTMTDEGLIGTPLPLILKEDEGACGTLYGHLARPNPQWKLAPQAEALVIFPGPDAYISPSWYAAKAEHHKVVPTWNYGAVHAYGTPEFFEDPDRLLGVLNALTDQNEANRPSPWSVSDAPEKFVQAQMRGIVGLRLEIARLEGKQKFSQNKPEADRAGVAKGLAEEADPSAQEMAGLIPR